MSTATPKLNAIADCHSKTMPGQWYWFSFGNDKQIVRDNGPVAMCRDEKDAQFICRIHNAMPALLEYIRELEDKVLY